MFLKEWENFSGHNFSETVTSYQLCLGTPLPWTSTSVFARTVAGLGMDAPMRPRPLPN